MRLAKTDRARAALEARDPAISVAERRVLILCDGQRSDADIVALLGAGAAPAVARLLASGYVQLPEAGPRAGKVASAARLGARVQQQRTQQPRPQPSVPTPDAIPTPAPPEDEEAAPSVDAPTPTRRSLLAARMYLLDMLALQRGVDAQAQVSALREARSEAATLDALAAGLALLHRLASASYCERVELRLREVLPIDQLDAWTARSRMATTQTAAREPATAAQPQPSL